MKTDEVIRDLKLIQEAMILHTEHGMIWRDMAKQFQAIDLSKLTPGVPDDVGEGFFRLKRKGDSLQDGDEFRCEDGGWMDSACGPNNDVHLHSGKFIYRRPIPPTPKAPEPVVIETIVGYLSYNPDYMNLPGGTKIWVFNQDPRKSEDV